MMEICLDGKEASALRAISGEILKLTKGLGSTKNRWVILIKITTIGKEITARSKAVLSFAPPLIAKIKASKNVK